MTGLESFRLARHLAAAGYRLSSFPYSSFGETLPAVVERCARFAQRLRDGAPGQPLHFIGHSLGGIVLHALSERGGCDDARSRVVFLGTPAVDCRAGAALAAHAAGRLLLGTIGRAELAGPRDRRWRSAAPLGIVAGNRPLGLGGVVASMGGPHDGAVAVDETRLPGAADHLVLPVSHSQMLFSAEVARQVISFLRDARFDRGG